jgi:hypothetical protein
MIQRYPFGLRGVFGSSRETAFLPAAPEPVLGAKAFRSQAHSRRVRLRDPSLMVGEEPASSSKLRTTASHRWISRREESRFAGGQRRAIVRPRLAWALSWLFSHVDALIVAGSLALGLPLSATGPCVKAQRKTRSNHLSSQIDTLPCHSNRLPLSHRGRLDHFQSSARTTSVARTALRST